jgi:competence protein ComGC
LNEDDVKEQEGEEGTIGFVRSEIKEGETDKDKRSLTKCMDALDGEINKEQTQMPELPESCGDGGKG